MQTINTGPVPRGTVIAYMLRSPQPSEACFPLIPADCLPERMLISGGHWKEIIGLETERTGAIFPFLSVFILPSFHLNLIHPNQFNSINSTAIPVPHLMTLTKCKANPNLPACMAREKAKFNCYSRLILNLSVSKRHSSS